MSLNNHKYINWPTLIELNPYKYNQGLRYYPFMVNLDRLMKVVTLLAIHPKNMCPKQNRRCKIKHF